MITEFQQKMLALMIFLIMLGMGAGLTLKDFLLALKKPYGIFIGFLSQFGFMPLIAFGLGLGLNLTPEQAVGLIIMGCVPGGTTSNIFTYFSKGNLALSVLMTVNSTLFAMLVMPPLLYLYTRPFVSADFQVPIQNISLTLALLLVPVCIGMGIRRLNANWGAVIELGGGILGILVIGFLLVTWVPTNSAVLATTPWQAYLASVALGLFGFVLGYWFSRAVKLHPRNCRTVALETGIQNGPLAVGIVLLSFSDSVLANKVVLIPVLYSLFILLTATLATLYFRRANTLSEQKIPDLL